MASPGGTISVSRRVEHQESVETPVLPSSGERSRAALPPSTRVGRYVVLGELGEGGMGRVYAAYDPELDRRIALKLLRPELATRRDPSMGRARLLREAQAMARLSHPNVLTVHDVGEIDSGILDGDGARSLGTPLVFIAMELVDGKDVRAWMLERRRSWREVVAVFVQAGEGLAAAHDAGLLHRDFKPDNVLIDDRNHVRVMDFGLARGFDERADNDPRELAVGTSSASLDHSLTHPDAAMGTPPYMPPEQWRHGELDPRADQFAFCVSMWEALYGTRPYRASAQSTVRETIESGSITPPDGEHSAPLWLRQALERGLEPDPERRHASMRALVDLLQRRPRRRRLYAYAGAGAFAVFCVAGVAYVQGRGSKHEPCRGAAASFGEIWSAPRRESIREAFMATRVPFAEAAWATTSEALDRHADRWIRRHTETCEATHLHGTQSAELLDLRMDCLERQRTAARTLTDLLADADAALVERAPSSVAALPDPDQCAQTETLRARMPAEPELRARVSSLRDELTQSRVNLDNGRPGDAAEVAERIAQTARELGVPALEAEALRMLGETFDRRGEVERASEFLHQALLLAERAGDDELAGALWSLLTFVDGYARGRVEAGLLAADHAEAKLDRMGAHPIARAQLDAHRAAALLADARYEDAARYQQAAIDAVARARGEDDLLRARYLTNLGAMQLAIGEPDAALASHVEALQIQEKALGPEHPALVLQHGGMANIHHAQARFEQARTHLERALAIIETQTDPDRRELANVLNNLGNVLAGLGEHEQALERLEHALALRRTIVGATNPDVAQSLENIGSVLLTLDRAEEALARHDEALLLRLQLHGREHPFVAYSLHGIGSARLELGRADAAIEPLERALALRTQAEPTERAATELALARALWDADVDRTRARELARTAYDRATSSDDATDARLTEQIARWLAEHGESTGEQPLRARANGFRHDVRRRELQ